MQNQTKPTIGTVITAHDGAPIAISFDDRFSHHPVVRLHFLWVGDFGAWWAIPVGMHLDSRLACLVPDEKKQGDALVITKRADKLVMGRWVDYITPAPLLPGHVIQGEHEGFWRAAAPTGGDGTTFMVRSYWSGNKGFWTLSDNPDVGIIGFIEPKADPWNAVLVTYVNRRNGDRLTFKGVTIKWPRRKPLQDALGRPSTKNRFHGMAALQCGVTGIVSPCRCTE